MFKKTYLSIFILFIITACSTKNNIIRLEPKIILPTQKSTFNAASISVNNIDNRTNKYLSEVNRNGNLVVFELSRDPSYLMQEVVEKQMMARGIMLASQANINLIVQLNKLEAKINEGSLRHNITINSNVSITATTTNGLSKTRSFTRSFNTQEFLSANNKKIQIAVNNTLTNLINDMANDNEIADFIQQNSQF
ncbi:Uncharacterized lipoprotein YajG [Candidatus Providencia siddallii]|uniref:Uncharacterized lipoprotein YajG n=1 Tax=Candidatus Providencia siddallii TaxID=1715285 RepID=A0A0M6W839_9GAMM|nr:Uncharacterized lipoprotein YajG [Candidatus Providencia siddallii]